MEINNLKNRVHLTFDCESVGTSSDAVILGVAFVAYNLVENANTSLPELQKHQSFFRKLNVEEQVKAHHRKIESSTLDWWMKQSAEARKILKPSAEDVDLQTFFADLKKWLGTMSFSSSYGTVWTRGGIDMLWLDSLAKNIGLQELGQRPMRWYLVRDIRTAVDVLGASSKFNGMPDAYDEYMNGQIPNAGQIVHDPVFDCLKNIACLRVAGVFPSPEDLQHD